MPSKSAVKAILGGSPYFIDTKLRELATKLSGDIEEHTFYADEMNADDFYNAVLTASLFNDYKLIKLAKCESVKKIADLLKNPKELQNSPNAIIITCADTKKTTELQKLLPSFESFVECKRSDNERARDIVGMFKQKGLTVNEQAAFRIGTEANWEMADIAGLAERLSLYFAGKSPTMQEVLSRAEGGAQENVFRLIDAFMSRDRKKAVFAYTALEDPQAEASQAFYMLTMYMAALYCKLSQTVPVDASIAFFGGKTYFIRTVDAHKHRWKTEDAARLIEEMHLLDVAIKTGQVANMTDALIMLIGKL